MKRLLIVLLLLCLLIPAHAESSFSEAEWQAFYDKVDSMYSSELNSNSIIDCLQQIVGTPSSITQVMQYDVPACAQFVLSPETLFAGPGGINAELTAFFPPKDQQWTRSDLWGFYGEIVAYLDAHYASVIADGYLLSEGDSIDNDICIVINFDGSNYISFYNQILGEITTYLND